VSATGLARAEVPKPPGFWQHAAAAAAGCSTIALRFGMPKGDAFAAGLLHDLGIALLHAFDPVTHAALLEQHGMDGPGLLAAEVEAFGLGHDQAAAQVLTSWRFPAPFVSAAAHHHGTEPSNEPLIQVVRIGDLLAHLSACPDDLDAKRRVGAALGLTSGLDVDALVDATIDRAGQIMASLAI
jgi:HD-like signal output (HDOD) protein